MCSVSEGTTPKFNTARLNELISDFVLIRPCIDEFYVVLVLQKHTTMKATSTERQIRKETLFQILFMIQSTLDQFSSEVLDYRSDVDEINERIDTLIQRMIDDFEETYFD